MVSRSAVQSRLMKRQSRKSMPQPIPGRYFRTSLTNHFRSPTRPLRRAKVRITVMSAISWWLRITMAFSRLGTSSPLITQVVPCTFSAPRAHRLHQVFAIQRLTRRKPLGEKGRMARLRVLQEVAYQQGGEEKQIGEGPDQEPPDSDHPAVRFRERLQWHACRLLVPFGALDPGFSS